MSREVIPAVLVGVYILILYVVSWYSRRLSARGGLTGYFLAGRGMPAACQPNPAVFYPRAGNGL